MSQFDPHFGPLAYEAKRFFWAFAGGALARTSDNRT